MEKLYCPVCGKRACDIKKMKEVPVELMIKCPNCKRLVSIQHGLSPPERTEAWVHTAEGNIEK